MNGLDLFSGIGGIGHALRPWVRTVAYCERDRYAQSVLLSRMQSGDIDLAPIWDDVTTLHADVLPRGIDIIFGGFPCQDISVAGAGKGLDGERSGLFVHIIRLAKEIKPTFIFLENVPAIRTRGLDMVLRQLSEIGYDARWTIVSAEEVGASHRRERWFLLAHANGKRLRKQQRRQLGSKGQGEIVAQHDGAKEFVADADRDGQQQCAERGHSERLGFGGSGETMANASGERLSVGRQPELAQGDQETKTGLEHESKRCGENVADTESVRLETERQSSRDETKKPGTWRDGGSRYWWSTEPDVGRVVNGLPNRVDRIKCLGNSVVPIQAQVAFERLIGLSK